MAADSLLRRISSRWSGVLLWLAVAALAFVCNTQLLYGRTGYVATAVAVLAFVLALVPVLLVPPPQLPLKQSVVSPNPITPLQCINSLLPPPPQAPLAYKPVL